MQENPRALLRVVARVPLSIPAAEHTPGHVACPACERYLAKYVDPETMRAMKFKDAAPKWFAVHRTEIAAGTIAGYEYFLRQLTGFFGDIQLDQIHIGNVEAYQDKRVSEDQVGASCVNHEASTLKQVLEYAGLWAKLAERYKPVKRGKAKVGRALEPDVEERLFQVAASNPRWRVAYWGSLITATTTAGHGEIRHLHVNDIDLANRKLRIRDGLKNVHRDRVVWMNDTAVWAAGQILKRYHKICERRGFTSDEEHYALPGRSAGAPYDPWKPMGSWKKAWGALRAAAGLPDLRMHDLRHQSITRVLEDPETSDETIEQIAGHVTAEQKKTYSHTRIRAQQVALSKLEIKRPVQREDREYRCYSPQRKRLRVVSGEPNG